MSSQIFDEFHAAMTAATRGNVSVYPINPRGLDPEGTGLAFLEQMMNFRALAEATGGRALTNSNSFDVFFERIVRENSSYYLLGYTSTNERRDVAVSGPDVESRTVHADLQPAIAAVAAVVGRGEAEHVIRAVLADEALEEHVEAV